MALVSMKSILANASQQSYAVPAFNIDNMEIIQAIIEIAEEENSPVILQIGQGAINDGNLVALATLAKKLGSTAKIPLALHLDHGSSYPQIIRCIREGFTSVMIDGSSLPLQDNIELTRKVAEAAHAVDLSVEGELGVIPGVEDNIAVDEKGANKVSIDDVKVFIDNVELDALAIAIGNAHGIYKGEPKLDFQLLSEVDSLTDIPLVLHGGSGIPDKLIREAISLGVNKINVATEIRNSLIKFIVDENFHNYDIYQYLNSAREGVRKIVREKILLFEAAGKA